MPQTHALFRQKAPGIMALLIRDFPIAIDDAAAILGNLGHECGGFELMQELKPTVAGSAGGYGWAMWTGPRRRAFEAYCDRNGMSPADDKANYGFLFVELKTTEKAAIAAVTRAGTLDGKVRAFELAFERAGVKHYASRNAYAAIALEAFDAARPVAFPAWSLPAAGEPASTHPPTAPVSEPTPTPETAPASPAGPETAPETGEEGTIMGNYSKLFGSLIGGVIGIAVSKFGLPAELATPEIVGGITAIVGGIFTWGFPKNQPN